MWGEVFEHCVCYSINSWGCPGFKRADMTSDFKRDVRLDSECRWFYRTEDFILLFGLLPESEMMKVYGGLDYGNIRIGGLVLRLFFGGEEYLRAIA
jgi:hypothetical protein